MARDGLTFQDLIDMATRVGVQVIAAPSSHRGQLGTMGTVVGLTRHHTGTPNSVRPTEDFPDYAVVKEGRVGLVNSLSAFGLGRRTSIYVFSEFLSWHAGSWNWQGITDGNGHFLGIEAAGIGDWTDWQRDVYPRLCASILLAIGEGIDMMPRHLDGATPAGRKTDMANEWPEFRAQVATYLAHPELIPVTAATPEVPDMLADEREALFKIAANSDATNSTVGLLNVAVRDGSGGLLVRTAKLEGVVAGLVTAIGQVQGGKGLDAQAVSDAAERGAQLALAQLGDALKGA